MAVDNKTPTAAGLTLLARAERVTLFVHHHYWRWNTRPNGLPGGTTICERNNGIRKNADDNQHRAVPQLRQELRQRLEEDLGNVQ
jgi:hypothetical protein